MKKIILDPDTQSERREIPRASEEAWRSVPSVRREYERGLRNGWISAAVFYTIASTVLVLAFHVLGCKP